MSEVNTEIKVGSRVRVAYHKGGYHKRNFTATCKGWTKGGQIRVLEDGTTKIVNVSSEHVTLIKQ